MRVRISRNDARTDRTFRRYSLDMAGKHVLDIEITAVPGYKPLVFVKGNKGGVRASFSVKALTR